jgi:TP901-1 family phage major tail protein
MAAQAGRSLLMKVGNAGSPETFTTIGGMRSTTITLNDEIVDTTNKDSTNQARTLLAQAGVKSGTVAGSGVFTDSASETTLYGKWHAATNANYQFLVPNLITITGAFQLASLEYAGEYNGEVTYSFTFESAGDLTIATV